VTPHHKAAIAKFVAILPAHKAGLTLDHNTHHTNKETVADLFKSMSEYYSDDAFVDENQKQKCLELNEIWTLQWYPNTPVGSHSLSAATLDVLIAWMIQDANGAIDVEEVSVLTAQIVELLPPHKGELTLEHNDHLGLYSTAGDQIEWNAKEGWPHIFTSDADRQVCIDTNEIWELRWNPEIANPGNKLSASSLEILLDSLNKN
jgi:hypothetical protein